MNLKEKAIEFSEWCSINNYTYLPKSKEWRMYKMNGFYYYTSDELYQKYLESKK